MLGIINTWEDALGLHEVVEIIYVVDGYEAIFYIQDGQLELHRAKGATVARAMVGLLAMLKEAQWDERRR